MKIFSRLLWGILAIFFVVICIAGIILTSVAYNNANAINMIFNTSSYKTVDDPDAEATVFYETSYEFERTGETMFEEDSRAIEEAEREGSVLLWNKDALPLSGSEKASLLGISSVDLVESGSGSGYIAGYDYSSNRSVKYTMKDAFEERGFVINETLWNFYESNLSKYKRTDPQTNCKEWQIWEVNEMPASEYGSVKSSFSAYNDLAVVVFSRSGGEYSDLHYNYESSSDFTGNQFASSSYENTAAEGGYLGLTDEEEDLLEMATDGTFKKVVVLLNTANPLQMQDFEKYYDKIDACMWIGQPGTTGINGVVDLLLGIDRDGNKVSPSGRTSDTWLYDNNSAPAAVNDGNYRYANNNLLPSSLQNNKHDRYMVYQEGIYVGYRYYETRYNDVMEGSGNADSTKGAKHSSEGWNYDEEVAVPFGYGVSYTDFEYSDFEVVEEGEDYVVSVDVKNIGYYPGKEVVQVYLQKPYTPYDEENGIEKAAIELAGYAKTILLAPSESETVKISVPKESFKSYDANYRETYIIENGTYYLTVAQDAHAAVNNILGLAGDSEVVMGDGANTKVTSYVGNAEDFVYSIPLNADNRTYSKSSYTGEEIYNKFDSGDINKYSFKGENSVTYLSRSDWAATYPEEYVQLSLNSQMAGDINFDNVPDDSDYDMPSYGVFKSGSTDGMPNPEEGDLVAYQFIDAPLYPENEDPNDYYNDITYGEWDDMWNQLLDQMTYQEQSYIVVSSSHWIHGASSISLPESRQEGGPVGLTRRTETDWSTVPNDDGQSGNGEGVDDTGWVYVAYPCAGILGSSFNDDIAEMVGRHKGEDALYLGYNGIYGPGANIHRSPYGGRAFEYPSEDPYLTGMIEAHEVIGIETKGCMAYIKHYALNDQEMNRVDCGIWSNEQTTREIYLKAFELVFTEGHASATMNSFTRVGTVWCGASKEMMTDILRGEWGFEGIVISDWVTTGSAMSSLDGVLAGTDTFDGSGNASGPTSSNDLTQYSNNAAVAQAVRTSTKRVIYNVVRTNAMNGTSISTKVVPVTPWWQTALLVLDYVSGALGICCIAMFAASLVLHNRRKKKNTHDEEDDRQNQIEPSSEQLVDNQNDSIDIEKEN